MVYVSEETPQQTNVRLKNVIRVADFRLLKGSYSFAEHSWNQGAIMMPPEALALVRDEASYSFLVPHEPGTSAEIFGVFSFHFQEDQDNSGFVGWLASLLKQKLGTGVFVICGSNSEKGGIYDYWGVPENLFADAVLIVEELRK